MSGAAAAAPYPPFDHARLRRLLPARQRLGERLLLVAQAASTQDLLRGEAERLGSLAGGLLVIAESQGAGRGRRTRDWWSGPPRANLALSLAVAGAPDPPEALGMHAACALAEACGPELPAGATLALKWPNDLLRDGAKIAGLLVEVGAAPGLALLGVGVNLRVAPPADAAPYPTGCLNPAADREAFVARWLLALERRLDAAARRGHAALERDCLRLLRAWAPHGVREPRTAEAGPLLEFSVHHGLRWGEKGREQQRPLGWIESLEALPAPAGPAPPTR